jgi:hypothetical protein
MRDDGLKVKRNKEKSKKKARDSDPVHGAEVAKKCRMSRKVKAMLVHLNDF